MGISAAWGVHSVDSSFVLMPTHGLTHSSVIIIFVYYMFKLGVQCLCMACSINTVSGYKNPRVKSVLHHVLFRIQNWPAILFRLGHLFLYAL